MRQPVLVSKSETLEVGVAGVGVVVELEELQGVLGLIRRCLGKWSAGDQGYRVRAMAVVGQVPGVVGRGS